MGKGTNTTSTSSSPNPAAMQAYYNLIGRAGEVANTPYQPYTGDLVAPVNAQQTTGINAINANAGFAQPYIQQASGFATQAAQPLTAAQIQQYQSPYTQSVVDATTNWFNNQNKQQQQNVLGNAAAQGALGGDRVGVAQANLAAQQTASQAPIIAGLYNQGYQQALGVAQQQQANMANAAYSLGNLGVAGQNAALTGANAQVGAGSLEQQNEQARLNALYNQFQIQQAFPYQQTQWLAGIDTGVGSQLGGTSSTTGPAPNPFAQYAGLGLAAAGMFLKSGGRVKGFAPGGDVGGVPYSGVSGWIPVRSLTMGRGAPPPPNLPGAQAAPVDATKAGLAFADKARQHDWGFGSSPMDISAEGVGGFTPSAVGTSFDWTSAPIGVSGLYRDGGRVRGFADGGTPFGDRFTAAYGGPDFDAAFSPFSVPPENTPANRDLALGLAEKYNPVDPIQLYAGAPVPRPRPFEAPPRMDEVEPQPTAVAGVTAPSTAFSPVGDLDNFQPRPDNVPARGFAPSDDELAATPITPTRDEAAGGQKAFGLGLIPADLKRPLLTAGLAMLASRSPFLGNAIGEGGLAGVQAYTQAQQQEIAQAEKAETRAQQSRRLDLEAQRLSQAADDARRRLAETSRHNLATEEAGRQTREMTERRLRVPAGYQEAEDGSLRPIPGGPQDPAVIKAAAEAKRGTAGLLDEDTISDMAGQYLAGDKSVMQNLGRGAQGAENIVKLRAEIARQAREAGMKPDQVATRMADFAGRTAAMRTLGTRGANVEYAGNTAANAIKLAEEASDKLPRSQFVPFNRLAQLVQTNMSSPEQADFFAKTNTLVNEYARVTSGGSAQSTESQRNHARELLNTAQGPAAYKAVLNAMRQEIAAAKKAYQDTRSEFLSDHTPSAQPAAPAAPAAAAPAGTPARVKQNGHTYEKQPDGSYKAID